MPVAASKLSRPTVALPADVPRVGPALSPWPAAPRGEELETMPVIFEAVRPSTGAAMVRVRVGDGARRCDARPAAPNSGAGGPDAVPALCRPILFVRPGAQKQVPTQGLSRVESIRLENETNVPHQALAGGTFFARSMELDQDHFFDRHLTPELSQWAEEARKQQQRSAASPGASLDASATQCYPQACMPLRHVQPEQHKRSLAPQPGCYSGQPASKRLRPVERAHSGWGPFDSDGHRLSG